MATPAQKDKPAAAGEDGQVDLVQNFREQMEARRAELQPFVDEFQRIDVTLHKLDMDIPAEQAEQPAPQPKRQSSASNGNSGRGRPGKRAQEFLNLVKSRPGITIKEAAEAMGLEQPNYLYRVAPNLTASGDIRKEGSGYFPVAS